MIRALLLIFEPTGTWNRIYRARRSILFILIFFLLPLLLFTAAAEGYGLVNWGRWQGEIARLKKLSIAEAVVVESAQVLLSLLTVFVGANLIKTLGETFRGRHTHTQAFTTVAYSLSPLFLLRLMDLFSSISPWISWSIGIVLSLGALYHGMPRIMGPDPSHAFGLFFLGGLLLLLLTGAVRFVTGAYLEGKFPKLQLVVSDLASRLPF